ncbi:MAG: hypothetical protein Udaeo2_33660 [Candidatus Udaeobacter sp.]|nr:MAG: hypothetical protein Udaeo2_33660 [Candidatus Udaeobacter sp.]
MTRVGRRRANFVAEDDEGGVANGGPRIVPRLHITFRDGTMAKAASKIARVAPRVAATGMVAKDAGPEIRDLLAQ